MYASTVKRVKHNSDETDSTSQKSVEIYNNIVLANGKYAYEISLEEIDAINQMTLNQISIEAE